MSKAIGMIEFKTTSTGVTAADAMVKTSEVEIVEAQTVCPGKYIAIITGDLSAVKAAVDTAVTTYEDKCIDSFVLGNPHESIFPAIYGTTQVEDISALGILETYDAAISFAKKYPDTAWCYGNHDLSYVWHVPETGYSTMAAYTVQKKLLDLKEVLPESNPIKYAHRIDNVLFSHAGISKDFVDLYVPKIKHDDVDTVLNYINNLGKMKMWYDGSPIWLRPQYTDVKMYK